MKSADERRAVCLKCGKPGITARRWTLAAAGIDPADPGPHIFGDQCDDCVWPVALCYDRPGQPPRAIYGPKHDGPDCFAYEAAAWLAFESHPDAGERLKYEADSTVIGQAIGVLAVVVSGAFLAVASVSAFMGGAW